MAKEKLEVRRAEVWKDYRERLFAQGGDPILFDALESKILGTSGVAQAWFVNEGLKDESLLSIEETIGDADFLDLPWNEDRAIREVILRQDQLLSDKNGRKLGGRQLSGRKKSLVADWNTYLTGSLLLHQGSIHGEKRFPRLIANGFAKFWQAAEISIFESRLTR